MIELFINDYLVDKVVRLLFDETDLSSLKLVSKQFYNGVVRNKFESAIVQRFQQCLRYINHLKQFYFSELKLYRYCNQKETLMFELCLNGVVNQSKLKIFINLYEEILYGIDEKEPQYKMTQSALNTIKIFSDCHDDSLIHQICKKYQDIYTTIVALLILGRPNNTLSLDYVSGKLSRKKIIPVHKYHSNFLYSDRKIWIQKELNSENYSKYPWDLALGSISPSERTEEEIYFADNQQFIFDLPDVNAYPFESNKGSKQTKIILGFVPDLNAQIPFLYDLNNNVTELTPMIEKEAAIHHLKHDDLIQKVIRNRFRLFRATRRISYFKNKIEKLIEKELGYDINFIKN